MKEDNRPHSRNIDVIIPAYNEEEAIAKVVRDIPKNWVRDIVVADNGSEDNTAEAARSMGATVVFQPVKGYGNACLKAMEYIAAKSIKPDIILFIDGDYSDFPEQLPLVVNPIIKDQADLVIGSRALGKLEKGAMMPQQIFGNWLATSLIKWIYKVEFSDLGPFRAIRYTSLEKIAMEDRDFGWTVEMQVKAAKYKLRCKEVAVDYRKRIGTSKVSGTVKGTILAGHKILWTIFKLL